MTKPNVKTAMENLIKEARAKMPFNLSFGGNCEGRCDEYPEKLLEYLDIDLLNWEDKLKKGIVPTLTDLERLGRECRETYEILKNRGIIQATT
jgi:hypothetical protein